MPGQRRPGKLRKKPLVAPQTGQLAWKARTPPDTCRQHRVDLGRSTDPSLDSTKAALIARAVDTRARSTGQHRSGGTDLCLYVLVCLHGRAGSWIVVGNRSTFRIGCTRLAWLAPDVALTVVKAAIIGLRRRAACRLNEVGARWRLTACSDVVVALRPVGPWLEAARGCGRRIHEMGNGRGGFDGPEHERGIAGRDGSIVARLYGNVAVRVDDRSPQRAVPGSSKKWRTTYPSLPSPEAPREVPWP